MIKLFLFLLLTIDYANASAPGEFCVVARRAPNINPINLKYQPGHALNVLFEYPQNKITIIESPGNVGAISSEPDTVKRLLTFPVRRNIAMECHALDAKNLNQIHKILKKEKNHLDHMTFTFQNILRNCVDLTKYLYKKVHQGESLRAKGISGFWFISSPDELFWTLKGRSINKKPRARISYYVNDGDVLEFFINKLQFISLNKRQKHFYDLHIAEATTTLKILKNKEFKAIDESKQDGQTVVNLIEKLYFDILKIQ